MAYAVVFHPSLPASPAGGFENTGQIPEKIGRRIASYFLRYSLCLALYKKIPGKIPGKKKVPTRLWNGSQSRQSARGTRGVTLFTITTRSHQTVGGQ